MNIVSELIGKELDYWVAKSNGWVNYPTDSMERGKIWHTEPDKAPFGNTISAYDYIPSTDAYQCMQLMKENFITVLPATKKWWTAELCNGAGGYGVGLTINLAVCRAFVNSRYGEEINEQRTKVYSTKSK